MNHPYTTRSRIPLVFVTKMTQMSSESLALGDTDLKLCKIAERNAQTSIAWVMFPVPKRLPIPVTMLLVATCYFPTSPTLRPMGTLLAMCGTSPRHSNVFKNCGWVHVSFDHPPTHTHTLYFLVSLISSVMSMHASDGGFIYSFLGGWCFICTSSYPDNLAWW